MRTLLCLTMLVVFTSTVSSAAPLRFDVLVASGDDAPGTDTGMGPASFTRFARPAINNNGDLAFLGRVAGGGTNSLSDTAIFAGENLIARTGDVLSSMAPDGENNRLRFLSRPSINDRGQVAFGGSVYTSNPLDIRGAVFGPAGLVAQEGGAAPVPDTGGGPATFELLVAPSLSNSGELAFYGLFRGGGPAPGLKTGAFTSTGARILEDTPAPGSPGLTIGGVAFSPVINDLDQIAVDAILNPNVGDAIFIDSFEVIRSGDIAPGTATGPSSAMLDVLTGQALALNNSGEVAFQASLDGVGVAANNDTGVFTSRRTVAREGDLAPGTDRGAGAARFGDLDRGLFNPLSLNGMGQVLFSALLDGPGVASGTSSIWFWDPRVGLREILREGDPFVFSGGDVRTIERAFVDRESLNDAGQIAATLRFTDGSEAIVLTQVQLAPVPVPPALGLLFSGVAILALMRHARQR